MKITIVAHPYGIGSKNITAEIVYTEKNQADCPFFSQDGELNIPLPETYVEDIFLDSCFSFSGIVFKKSIVNKEKTKATIYMTEITISKDGIPCPELSPSEVTSILLEYE